MNDFITIFKNDDIIIGYWKGTKDFQWIDFDKGAEIFHYNIKDIENLKNIINDTESYEKICDIIADITNK